MRRSRDELGSSTAEYAVGTLAAAGFAAVLIALWPWIDDLIRYCLFNIVMFLDQAQFPVIPT